MDLEASVPSVRLSPKAMKRVTEIRGGGGDTVTVKLQEADCWRASVAVHVTGLAPTGKAVPLDGVHVTVTGGAPPVIVDAP